MKIIVIAVGILLLFAGCVQEPAPVNTPTVPSASNSTRGHDIFQAWAEQHSKTIEETQQFFENTYAIAKEDDIFQELPPIPDDFQKWKEAWEKSDLNQLINAPENTYIQPEFYPTFEESGTNPWKNATSTHPTTFGIMSTPADQEITIPREETTFETTLFVGSAWGTTYYQGIGLTYTLTPEAPFTIEISPKNILAGPTFPQFSKEWIHRIHIQGNITPQEGVKTYTLHLYPAAPTSDNEQQWYATYSPYLRADTTFVNPEGVATLTINIQEE